MENSYGKGNNIFLSVVALATLLVAIVGATFAWLNVQTNPNIQPKQDASISNLVVVTFDNNGTITINGSDLQYGWNKEIVFKIKNENSDNSVNYNLTVNTSGSDAVADAIKYSFNCTSNSNGQCPTSTSSMPINNTNYKGTLSSKGEEHTFKVNLSLENDIVNSDMLNENFVISYNFSLSEWLVNYGR